MITYLQLYKENKLRNMNFKTIGIWALRLVAAYIMLQTLFYKFSASEESVYIFTQLGIEPWGRIGTGVLEFIASLLLLWPRTTHFGAILGAGLMSGALFSHATKLGIEVKGDGGLLFAYAMIVLVCCIILLLVYKKEVLKFLPFYQPNKTKQ
jgi:uncharacterized membrane protein YphA (DoxX/SURF4 family)